MNRALRGADGTVYCYVIATVEYDGERFLQTGSGPNFEGGLVTLCTCKHWMRSYHSPEDWSRPLCVVEGNFRQKRFAMPDFLSAIRQI